MTRDHRDEQSADAGNRDVDAESPLDDNPFAEMDFEDFTQWLEVELAQLVSDFRDYSTGRSALSRR